MPTKEKCKGSVRPQKRSIPHMNATVTTLTTGLNTAILGSEPVMEKVNQLKSKSAKKPAHQAKTATKRSPPFQKLRLNTNINDEHLSDSSYATTSDEDPTEDNDLFEDDTTKHTKGEQEPVHSCCTWESETHYCTDNYAPEAMSEDEHKSLEGTVYGTVTNGN